MLRGDDVTQHTVELITLGVLPENIRAVAVYRECQATMLAGLAGAVYVGISASELRDAMWLERIQASQREDTRARVRVMEAAARQAAARQADARREEEDRKNKERPPAAQKTPARR